MENTPAEMLHLYIDGELNIMDEQPLFAELNINEELRSEMRDLLSIRRSVQNDSEAFAPPVESASFIFSKVGLNPPVSIPPPEVLQPIATTGTTFFSNLFRYVWAPILATVVSIIGTSIILTNYYNNKIEQVKSAATSKTSFDKFTETKENSNINKEIIPRITENKNISNHQPKVVTFNRKNTVKHIGFETVSNDKEVENAQESLKVDNPIFERNLSKTPFIIVNKNYNSAFNPSFNLNQIPFDNSLNSKFLRNKSDESSYSIYLRGIYAKSYPNTDLNTASNPLFTNMSLGAYISGGRHLQFGLEIGQEAFSQIFYNMENGIKWQYKQNPVIFWGAFGALVRTDKIAYLGGVQPFGQLLIGGNQLGPLGKLITGIQLNSPEIGVGLLLGLEGSMLFYTNQSTWYTSRKLGFTFGTSFNF